MRKNCSRRQRFLHADVLGITIAQSPLRPVSSKTCVSVETALKCMRSRQRRVEEVRGRYHLEDGHALVVSRQPSHIVVEERRALIEGVGAWRFDGCL